MDGPDLLLLSDEDVHSCSLVMLGDVCRFWGKFFPNLFSGGVCEWAQEDTSHLQISAGIQLHCTYDVCTYLRDRGMTGGEVERPPLAKT